MDLRRVNPEVFEIRKQNAKSVLKKLVVGVYAILMIGIIAYSLLFLAMVIM